MTENKNFINEVDTLGRSLMASAKGSKTDLGDKIAIFANMVKWAAIKNKIEPDAEEGAGWGKYGRILNNGSGRAGDTAPATKPKEAKRPRAPAVDDSAAAAEDRAIEENASRQHTGLGGLECDGTDSQPAAHSFPVLDGSLLFDAARGAEPGADALGSGGPV